MYRNYLRLVPAAAPTACELQLTRVFLETTLLPLEAKSGLLLLQPFQTVAPKCPCCSRWNRKRAVSGQCHAQLVSPQAGVPFLAFQT